MAALRAGEAIKTLHFPQPGKQTFGVDVLQQAAKFLDSRRPSHEDLNTAGIANEIGFVLLRNPYLPRLRTYGTRKHRLAIDSSHRPNTSAMTLRMMQRVHVLSPTIRA